MTNAPEGGVPPEQPLVELLRQAARGDEAAANRLLDEIRPTLHEEIHRLAGGAAPAPLDGSGVVQECLVNIWRSAGAVEATTDAQARAWLKTVARNEFLKAVRHTRQQVRDVRKQVPLPQDSGGAVPLAAATPTPSQELTRREEDVRREQALARLTPDDQTVLRLRFHEQQPWPEVAAHMGRTEAAVKRLYFRAVKRWKQETGDG